MPTEAISMLTAPTIAGLLLAVSSLTVVAGVAGAVGGLLTALGGLWFTAKRIGPERRQLAAQGHKLTVEAERIKTERELLSTELREAEERLYLKLRADLAREREERSDERHALKAQIIERDGKIMRLELRVEEQNREIVEWRGELATVKAQLDSRTRGRRSNDPPEPSG